MLTLTHIGIMVTDLKRSEEFYADVLGCRKSGKIENDDVRIAFMDFSNGSIELVQLLKGDEEIVQSPHSHLAFNSDDIDAEFARVKALGIETIEAAPREFSGGKLFFFKGPDGEHIEFCQGIAIDPV